MAKQFKNNFDNYVTPEQNYADYYRQAVEEDARKAAKKARDEYTNFTNNLSGLFEKIRYKLHGWSPEQEQTYNALNEKIAKLFG